MSYNPNQPRDADGKWAGNGSAESASASTSTYSSAPTSTHHSALYAAAGVVTVGAATLAMSPMLTARLGAIATSAATSTGTWLAKELVAATVGGGLATTAMSRVAGARLGAIAGPVGALVGALLAPALESVLTPHPEITAAVIGAAPNLLQHLLTGK